MTEPDLVTLLDSWVIHLKAEHKSPQTIKTYTAGVRRYIAFCERLGKPVELERQRVNEFIAELLDSGAEPATAVARQAGVRRFSKWLAEEGEIEKDILLGLKPPKLDEKLVDRLSEEECAAILAQCKGKSLVDRRDEALFRLMIETVLRSGELLALNVGDVDVGSGLAVIRRGKGAKGRRVPFGPQTGRAIDRYLRARARHPRSDEPALWLADRRGRLSYSGLRKSLQARAVAAGVTRRFHMHLTRHTGSQRWLSAGGSEGGLMAIGGWSRRSIMDRYTKATAMERAANEAKGLNLGDL